ncbi:N-formylglutamate deformylase [Aliikangiella sp. IMCC44653]
MSSNEIYNYLVGNCPILISMPHNGTAIPAEIAATMQPDALQVVDTDWYLDRLYRFAHELGCFVLKPNFSRYVIDLNRPESDESLYPGADTTELCPTTQFSKKPIYLNELPSQAEIERRKALYWRPYHQQLAESVQQIASQYGKCVLFEAHSIKSVVPRFFDGKLADFNFGTNGGRSCSPKLGDLLTSWQPPQNYSKVINQRFKGGYITRHYANPTASIETLQLELSQATYMNEERLEYDPSKAKQVIPALTSLIQTIKKYVSAE